MYIGKWFGKKKNPKKLARWKRKWAEPRQRQRQASSVNRVLMTSKSNESNGRLCGNAGFWLISSRFASWVAAVERERRHNWNVKKSIHYSKDENKVGAADASATWKLPVESVQLTTWWNGRRCAPDAAGSLPVPTAWAWDWVGLDSSAALFVLVF